MMSSKSLLHLHGNLPPNTIKLLESIQEWGIQELEPLIPYNWDQATFPPSILESFRKRFPHLLGYTLPRLYGGAGYDVMLECQISMTLASIDASFTTTLLVQYGLCAESILLCGNESQKQRLLPPLARLDVMGCFCLTEPESGSDASNLTTIATRLPEGGYRINGSKRWIGNAMSADVFVVWAKNVSLPGQPVMGFIVERSHQKSTDAIQTTKIQGKVSMRMLQNFDVEFYNVYCPDENVMGDYVGFAASVGRVLEASRVSVAWIPVGIALGALEKTYEYVGKRKAFQAPLSSYQLVQEKLVRMTSTVASMYLLVERVTQEFVAGRCGIATISMTKAHNTRMGREVVALCREVLGGNGIVLDYGVASKFCDMESTYTYEGTYDICVLVAGRKATGMSAIKSPAGIRHLNENKENESKRIRSKM